MRRAIPLGLTLATIAINVASPAANAAVADEMRAELSALGFAGATVAVGTPTGTTIPLNENATGDNLTIAQLEPYLSPNPASPKPVARIDVSVPTGTALSGLLTTPGLEGPSHTSGIVEETRAELAAFEAAKHAIARGADLVGINVTLRTGDAVVRYLEALPDATAFAPRQVVGAVMPKAELEDRLRAKLPSWALDGQLTVAEDTSGERVVTVNAVVPRAMFAVLDVASLTRTFDHAQRQLSPEGANIGRALVVVRDADTGDPLYVSGDDVLWTYRSAWYSPRVAAHRGASVDRTLTNATNSMPGEAPAGVP